MQDITQPKIISGLRSNEELNRSGWRGLNSVDRIICLMSGLLTVRGGKTRLSTFSQSTTEFNITIMYYNNPTTTFSLNRVRL